MDNQKPGGHAPLLFKAAEILGGYQSLRAFLHASPEQLERWMEGKAMLPTDRFLKLADLLAEHNRDFASRLRARQENNQQRMESSVATIEASRVALARLPDMQHWSIVLRSARLRQQERDATSSLRHRLFDPAFVPADRAELLETALDATLAAAGTDLGNVQLIDADGALHIRAYRGFDRPFLEFFSVVSRPECASGIAMSLGRQVFIPDLRRNSMFMGTEAGRVLESAGCAAVTSSPLVHDSGLVIGTISTHYRQACDEDHAALESLDLVAQRAASWLDARPG